MIKQASLRKFKDKNKHKAERKYKNQVWACEEHACKQDPSPEIHHVLFLPKPSNLVSKLDENRTNNAIFALNAPKKTEL